ncbi:MAG: hypothetical protein JSS65_03340 [Armatimonadetes bacterium]|nr:hypothetical protein [Armatimonadota bacterium]
MSEARKKRDPEVENATPPLELQVAGPADDMQSTLERLTSELDALKAKVVELEAASAPEPMLTTAGPEISADELAAALANPVDDLPTVEPEDVEVPPSDEEIAALTAEIHEKYPDIQGSIDAFNASPDEMVFDLDKIESGASTVVDQTSPLGTSAAQGSELDDLVSQIREPDDLGQNTVTIPDDGTMSDEDIAALLEQVQASEPVTPEEPAADGPMSDEEIAAMFAASASEPAQAAAPPEEPAADGQMSDEDIAAMFAASASESAQAAAPPEEPAADGPMSDEDIAAMFTASTPEPVQAAAMSEDDGDAPMSLEEIQALVLQSESLAPQPAPATSDPSDDGELRILGMDDLQNMLDKGANLTAPTADFVPPEPEPVAPDVPAGIPMVDEDEQFGGFDPPDESIAMVEDPTGMPLSASVEWDPEVVAQVPMALAVAAMALPLRWEDDKLVCSVADPIDHEAIGRLSSALHCMVDTRPAPMVEVVKGLRAAYRDADATSARLVMDDVSRARPGIVQLAVALWKKVA